MSWSRLLPALQPLPPLSLAQKFREGPREHLSDLPNYLPSDDGHFGSDRSVVCPLLAETAPRFSPPVPSGLQLQVRPSTWDGLERQPGTETYQLSPQNTVLP